MWPSFRQKRIGTVVWAPTPNLSLPKTSCFIILLHDRRKVAHFNVIAHPTAEWTARQLIESFPESSAPHHQIMGSSSPRWNFRYGHWLGRYSRLVSALWLFRSLNAQIENALIV